MITELNSWLFYNFILYDPLNIQKMVGLVDDWVND